MRRGSGIYRKRFRISRVSGNRESGDVTKKEVEGG